MKKNIIYCMLFVMAALLLSGCQKESANKTGMVDYVVIKLLGDKQMTLALGDTYVEPGFTATDKGEDVESTVVVYIIDMMGDEVDDIDTSTPGIFTIYYTATSQDNVTISENRVVMVYDPALEASIDGEWAVDFEKSQRVDGSSDRTWAEWSAIYTDPAQWDYAAYSMTKYTVTFDEIVPGIYTCNDLLGGFYTGLRGYGPMLAAEEGDEYYNYYSMGGMVLLNADLSINLISSHIDAWGDELIDLSGTLVGGDETKPAILELHSIYGDAPGMDFHVVMNAK